jgi:hypothetical protein
MIDGEAQQALDPHANTRLAWILAGGTKVAITGIREKTNGKNRRTL